ncbi:MAG: hypothetical protein IPK10_08065 [Bacteroidetes bacterium]|nr:hypothetical protein [Bacteroidota bacterium]
MIAGNTYYVQVDGYNATTNNNFNLLLIDEGDVPQLTASNGLSSCIRENFSTELSTTQMYNSYLWANGSTSPTLTATVAGTYVVTVSSDSGCFSIDSITISIPEETVAPNIAWQKSMGGAGEDFSYDAKEDVDGGIVSAGGSRSFNSGDVNVNPGKLVQNVWLFKLTDEGSPLWTRTFGGDKYDEANAVVKTNDGGYAFCGYSLSSTLDVVGSTPSGYQYGWMAKLDTSAALDPSGSTSVSWQKTNGNAAQFASEIYYDGIQTSDGNYVTVGEYGNFDNEINAKITKRNSVGTILWQKYYFQTDSLNDQRLFYAVQETGDRGLIAVGESYDANFGLSGTEFFAVKTDSLGNVMWKKVYGGSGYERAFDVQQTADGGYILVGSATSSDGNLSNNNGISDFWIVKLYPNGDLQWQKSYGGSLYENANSVKQTPDGGYIVAGTTYSNNGDVSGNHGANDYWILRLNSHGNLIWQKTLGGTGEDVATSVLVKSDGSYVVTGYSNSNNGDVSGNHGANDTWMVKLGAFQPQIIASSNLPLCDTVNNPITLTASAASSYLWSNGETTQSIIVTPPTAPQTDYYTLRIDGMDDCFTSDSVAVQYKPFVEPKINSSGGDSICPDQKTLLTLNTGYNSYYWSTAQTNSQIQVGAGLYNVMVTSANGCTGTAMGLVKAYETNVPPLIEWKKSIGGTAADSANSITITHDGFYLIAGTSTSNDGDVHGNLGSNDYWVVKLTTTGDTVWTRNFGGSFIDVINSIIEFKNDTGGYTYMITGRSNSLVTAGGKNSPPLGSNDYWTLELDQNGSKIIEFAHGAGGDDFSNALAATRVSNGFGSNVVALAGASSSSVNYWTQFDKKIYYTNNNGLKDFFILKLTTQLAVANYTYLGGSGDDVAKAMIRTPDEDLVVAGYSNSTNGDRTIGNHGANNDFWIAKLAMEGGIGNNIPTKLLWQKSFGGTGDDQAQSMIATVDGGFVIAGFSNSNDGDVIGGHGNYDYWIIKINKSGDLEWQKTLGGAGDDKAISIQQSFDGGYIVAGYSNSNNSGDVIGSHGGYDYWITKLDVNGTLIWQKPMGGSLNDFATGIQKSPDGGYLVSGHSFSNDLDIAGDHHGATSSSDIWIAKLTNGKATISPDSVVALCTDDPGTTVTLTASAGNSFLWNNGATTQSIHVNQSGNFYVNIDNTNHCFVSDTVEVNALPFVDPDVISNSGTDFCESLSATLSVTPSYASYLWSNGSTSSSIDVSIVGTYKVTVTAANGCTSFDSLAISGPAGINAPGRIEWQKAFGGSALDYQNDLYRTPDGGYLLSGTTESFDGDVTGNHGFSDFWLARIDTFENIQWQKAIGGSNGEQATCMRPTKDGGSIAVGYTNSNNYDVIGNHGGTDFFVVKTDFQGTIQWSKVLGGPLYDAASSVEQTADGGYIVAGSSAGNGGDVTGNHGGSDYWIVKLNSNGTVNWKKSYGGSNHDYATSIKQTADHGYIVVGYTSSYDGDVDTIYNGDFDYWILKLNVAGDIQWSKSFGGSDWDQATAVKQLPDGGYVVAGYTQSTNGDVVGNNGAYDFWILRLNATGSILWKNTYGGSDWDLAKSIEQTPEGGFLVGGYTSSDNSGDVGSNHGGTDFWLIKIDANGTLLWSQLTGGSGDEEAAALYLEKDGSYVMGGYSTSTDGDATGSGNHGAGDYWAVKFTNKASIFPTDSLFANCGDSIVLTANDANTYLWNNGATTQSIVVYNSGNYYVATNGQSDCFNSDTAYVTVYDPPSVGTISMSTTNVSGIHSYFTLNNAPNNATFQWGWGLQPGGPYTNFGSGGTYDSLFLVGVGTAYIVCKMTYGGTNGCVYTSNEIPLTLAITYDSVCNAAQLVIGLNGPFTNYGATAETGEVIPPIVTCNSQASWCPNQTLNNTVWFKFTAPASGKVSIHFIQPNWDSQIALWSAPNCNALLSGGATLIAANDDSTTTSPFNAYIAPVCLIPGKEYYIQVDGFNNATSSNFNLLLIDENNSLSFDGINDVVNTTGSAIALANSSFTVEVYAKRKTIGTNDIIISQGTGSTNVGLHLGFRNSNVFTFAFYGNDLNTPLAYTDTLWHLWSCVYSTTGIGDNRFIYRDGVLVASDRATANYTGSGVFQLGVSSFLSGYNYAGMVDEIRIWNNVRTPSQILQGLGQEMTSPQTGLQLYYKFNNGVAGTNNAGLTTVVDVSGNSRNGTLANFALNGEVSNWVNGVTRTLYLEADFDGYYSNMQDSLFGFCIPAGYAAVEGDCNDSSATSNPSNLYEISCNGVDDNCNGQIDENNSISFDGNSDYIEGVNTLLPQGNTPRTIEAWINPSITQGGSIFNWSSTTTSNTRAGILLVSGKLYYVGQFNDLTGVATIPLNTWTHVAATFDGTTLKLYVNGELDASAPKTFSTTGTTFTIGRSSVPFVQEYFNGKIDEIRVWNIARTQSEIRNSMLNGLPSTQSGMIAYYKFDQGIADGANTGLTLLPDVSSTTNKGTLFSFALSGSSSNWTTGSSTVTTLYRDFDNDGYGSQTVTSNSFCSSGNLYIGNNLDCNDSAATVYPGSAGLAFEISCNGIDDNCNGQIDENNSLSFDGTSDYISIPHASNLNPSPSSFTLEAWVNVTTNATNQIVIHKWIVNQYSLEILNTKASFVVRSSNGNNYVVNAPNAFPINQWVHLAGVYSGNNLYLYQNGVLVSITPFFGAPVTAASGIVTIGRRSETASGYLLGKVDEVSIWNVARTAAQILTDMKSGYSFPQSGLSAYYKFNQGVAGGSNAGETTLFDASGFANHGTVNSFALTGASSNFVSGNAPVSYPDFDQDGYYAVTAGMQTNSCVAFNYAVAGGDCNDNNVNINPGKNEINCNSTDDNCNGTINENLSLNFDGSNDEVIIPGRASLNMANFTVELWVKPTATKPAYQTIVLKEGASGNRNYGLFLNPNATSVHFSFLRADNVTFESYNSNSSLPLNVWSHVAMTYNGSAFRLYINGILDRSVAISSTAIQTTQDLRLGRGPGALSPFVGSMDEVRIWNVARTQLELETAMTNGLLMPQNNLVAYYKFDQGVSNGTNTGLSTLIDVSGLEHHGSLLNFALSSSTSNFTTGTGVLPTLYQDLDGDFYGNPSITSTNFCNGSIFIGNNTDCNDTNVTVVPTNVDEVVCNGSDDNCNGLIDENNGLWFDGINDIVTLSTGSTTLNGTFTVECWAKPNRTTGSMSVMGSRSPNSNGFDFKFSGGNIIHGDIGNGSTWLTNSADVPLNYVAGQWYHIAYVVEPTKYSIYLNGVLAARERISGTPLLLGPNNQLVLGNAASSGLNEFFEGTIDEVRIWSIARSSNDIVQAMSHEIPASTPGLFAYYNFNRGLPNGTNTGLTLLPDLTGNGRNGTLVNIALAGNTSNWTEGVNVTMYPDLDQDGYYSSTSGAVSGFCFPAGYAMVNGDCDDANNIVNPGKYEIICNGVDDNCNGQTDENNSLAFDGIDDYVAVPAPGISNPQITIESWIYKEVSSGIKSLYSTNGFTTGDIQLNLVNNNVVLSIAGNIPYDINLTNVPDNVWTHISVVYNATAKNVVCYLNGTNAGTYTYSIANNVVNEAGRIGGWDGATTRNYVGRIDEFRIWNSGSTQSQIFQRMNVTIPTSAIGLLVNYNFDQGISGSNNNAANRVLDWSGKLLHGTLNNFNLSGSNSNWLTGVSRTWYLDADGDSYGSKLDSVLGLCSPLGYVINNDDCNDGDANVHIPQVYYADYDQDGYGTGAQLFLCESTPPAGFSLNNMDCNDIDSTVQTLALFYVDADQDGYGVGNGVYICAVVAPLGYSSVNTDCNDADPLIHQPVYYFMDADGDGYGGSNSLTYCTSIVPPGYVANNSDCNDGDLSIHPAATEICNNGIDENCNGLVDEGDFVFPITITANGPTAFCTPDSVLLTATIPGERYAVEVLNFSSEYSPTAYSADMILGVPDVYPNYGDIGQAWAPLTTTGTREFIEIRFDDFAPVNFIDIYETFTPGAVDTVYVKNPNTGIFEVVYTHTAYPITPVSRILHITFPTTGFFVSEVRIAMNNTAVPGWNELDAVSIGITPDLPYSYLWSTGDTVPAIYASQPTFYNLFVTNGSGCVSSNFIIIQNTNPSLQISSNNVCVSNNDGSTNVTVQNVPEVLKITSPVPTEFQITQAVFGPHISNFPMNGEIVYIVNDSSLYNGCASFPLGSLSGKIALIDRGSCTFEQKVYRAQEAGAVGVIIVNNVPGPPFTMGAANLFIDTIPVVMVSDVDGLTIKDWLSQTQLVTAATDSFTYSWNTGATSSSIENLTVGLYTVTVTNMAGCSSTEIAEIKSAFDASILAEGATTICQGDSLKLIIGFETAMQFNGVDQWIDLGADVTNLDDGSFTIEAWVKTTGISEGVVVANDNNGAWEIGERVFYIDEFGRPSFVGYSNDFIVGADSVNDGNWHHIAVSKPAASSGGFGRIYIDGIDRTIISNYVVNNTANIGTFAIGKPNFFEAPNYFNGQIDEVRIWNVARSQNQIHRNRFSNMVIDTVGLLAYYKMNESSGSTVVNTVSNQFTGTTLNAPVRVATGEPYTYVWTPGGETNSSIYATTSGNYQVSITDQQGCVVNTLPIVVNTITCSGGVTVNLGLFVEGFYFGGGLMQSPLFNSFLVINSNECDTIIVELRDPMSPTSVVEADTVVLMTNGTASANFSALVNGNAYYIVVRGRNFVQTWTDLPVTLLPLTNYVFSTAASQAYGSNQIQVDQGVFAFYSGDLIPQDEFIDILDQSFVDNDVFNFTSGYVISDLSGDGFVDILDQAILDNNLFNFIGSVHP